VAVEKSVPTSPLSSPSTTALDSKFSQLSPDRKEQELSGDRKLSMTVRKVSLVESMALMLGFSAHTKVNYFTLIEM
jgi:hypothetical protein